LENKGRETYRKESTLARNPANPRPILASSPTNVALSVILVGEDYGLKVSINDTAHRKAGL